MRVVGYCYITVFVSTAKNSKKNQTKNPKQKLYLIMNFLLADLLVKHHQQPKK